MAMAPRIAPNDVVPKDSDKTPTKNAPLGARFFMRAGSTQAAVAGAGASAYQPHPQPG
ncbi:MAG: hypothetical protein GAK40_00491 [Burkholderia plantarii]|nr:MAG: hypothetical protein GAK40_00491 [Burkholderia plantarii]